MLNTLYIETFFVFFLQITMMTAMSALYCGETTSTSVSSVICARKKSHESEKEGSHVLWCIHLIMAFHQNSPRAFIGFDILKIQSFDFLFHDHHWLSWRPVRLGSKLSALQARERWLTLSAILSPGTLGFKRYKIKQLN